MYLKRLTDSVQIPYQNKKYYPYFNVYFSVIFRVKFYSLFVPFVFRRVLFHCILLHLLSLLHSASLHVCLSQLHLISSHQLIWLLPHFPAFIYYVRPLCRSCSSFQLHFGAVANQPFNESKIYLSTSSVALIEYFHLAVNIYSPFFDEYELMSLITCAGRPD